MCVGVEGEGRGKEGEGREGRNGGKGGKGETEGREGREKRREGMGRGCKRGREVEANQTA